MWIEPPVHLKCSEQINRATSDLHKSKFTGQMTLREFTPHSNFTKYKRVFFYPTLIKRCYAFTSVAVHVMLAGMRTTDQGNLRKKSCLLPDSQPFR